MFMLGTASMPVVRERAFNSRYVFERVVKSSSDKVTQLWVTNFALDYWRAHK